MIMEVINQLELKRQQPNIARESIEFITLMCKAVKPKNVLEIGTFNGYSALWLSLNSEKLTCLEINEQFVKIAQDNFDKAKARNITVIHGDAIETIKKLEPKFDLILIDAMKSHYKDYLLEALKVLNKNGLIFVDNTISHKQSLTEFFEYLKSSDLYYQELNLGRGLMVISRW